MNWAEVCGDVIYNLGEISITEVNIGPNGMGGISQIYNAGKMTLFGSNQITNVLKVYLELTEDKKAYYPLTIGENFSNTNSYRGFINLTFEEYLLNASVVEFESTEGYSEYKAQVEASLRRFKENHKEFFEDEASTCDNCKYLDDCPAEYKQEQPNYRENWEQ